MKSIGRFKWADILQFVFAVAATVLFIVKATFYNTCFFSEWNIVNFILCFPFFVVLGCVLFGKNKNPRKLIQTSLFSFLPGLVISIFDLSDFGLMSYINTIFENSYSYIMLVLTLIILYVIITISFMSKIVCFSTINFIMLTVLAYSFLSIDDCNSIDTIEMFSYSFLFAVLLIYASKLSFANEYDVIFIDQSEYDCLEENYSEYDIIIDLITEGFIFKGNYEVAKSARDFYYAIKNNDTDTIEKLNICGRKDISNIFRLWLECEDDFAFDRSSVEFFNLCKYLSSDKICDKDYEFSFYKFCQYIKDGKNRFGAIDIKLKSNDPANILSNLHDDKFTCFGSEFTSVESFLQGLKFKSIEKQAEIFKMSGKQAKRAGKHHNFWKLTGNLYFKGEKINRYNENYQKILTKIYLSRYDQSEKFRKALLNSGLKTLKHSIGKKSPKNTVLTVDEYLNILTYLRKLEFSRYYVDANCK